MIAERQLRMESRKNRLFADLMTFGYGHLRFRLTSSEPMRQRELQIRLISNDPFGKYPHSVRSPPVDRNPSSDSEETSGH